MNEENIIPRICAISIIIIIGLMYYFIYQHQQLQQEEYNNFCLEKGEIYYQWENRHIVCTVYEGDKLIGRNSYKYKNEGG